MPDVERPQTRPVSQLFATLERLVLLAQFSLRDKPGRCSGSRTGSALDDGLQFEHEATGELPLLDRKRTIREIVGQAL